MIITKMGNQLIGEFKFVCKNCGAEWVAERNEVKFTPPCLPYDVYMDCPCCKKTCYQSEEE